MPRRATAARAGKRETNKQANRAEILDAARGLFLEHGFEAVTIRDVIHRTRLATGTFYNYFRTKEDLLRALIEGQVLELTSRLREVRRAARSLEEFVRGAYGAAFAAIVSDPVLYDLMMRNEHAVRSLFQDSVMEVSTRALRDDIRDAIHRGIMPPLDADYLAAAFFGAGYEIGRLLAAGPRQDADAAADFATRLFLGGIVSFAGGRAPPPKPRVRAAV